VLADIKVKNRFQKLLGQSFRYYRPLYSVFAAVTLILILWFQFSIASPRLIRPTSITYLPGVLGGVAGIIVMSICINKYFYELSGLQALQQSTVKNTLQQSGLHKFVRHPLYLGTILFIWGLFLIFPFLNNLIADVIITGYVLFGIRLEEKKLYLEYGESYKEYAKKVPKLLPHLYK
jgi:protein-S-isoprenylcysteine O-methyltransferase Ste14